MKQNTFWIALVFVLLNILLRLPGIFQELPPYTFCDEDIFLKAAFTMWQHDDWRVGNFQSGGLNYYLPLLAAKITSFFHSGELSLTQFTMLSRFTSAVILSSLSVIFIFLATLELTSRRVVAILAATLFTFSPMALGVSRIHYPDHYIVVFSASVLWLSLKILFSKDPARYYTFAAIAVGMSASVKYNGALLVIPVGLAHLLRDYSSSFGEMLTLVVKNSRHMFWLAFMAVLTFLLLNNSLLFDFESFLAGFAFNVANYKSGGQWVETTHGYVFYTVVLYCTSFGLLAVLAYLCGYQKIYRENPKALIVLLTMPVLMILSMGGFPRVIGRNMIMGLPFVLPVLAVGLSFLYTQLSKRAGVVVAVSFILLIAAEPVVKSSYSLSRDFLEDARVQARNWVSETIPRGAKVKEAWRCFYPGVVDKTRFVVDVFKPPLELQHDKAECSEYIAVDQWFHWRNFEGNQFRMFTELVYSNIHFVNPSGFAYPKQHQQQLEVQPHLKLLKRFEGYGPFVEIYKVDDDVCL